MLREAVFVFPYMAISVKCHLTCHWNFHLCSNWMGQEWFTFTSWLPGSTCMLSTGNIRLILKLPQNETKMRLASYPGYMGGGEKHTFPLLGDLDTRLKMRYEGNVLLSC